MPELSVIVPCYNEARTLKQILEKVNSIPIDKEVIVVNDGSTDDTEKILSGLNDRNLKVIHHPGNRGKGSSVLTGLSQATGEFVIIQDADLEYDPSDYCKLIDAIKNRKADVVLGARFIRGYKGLFIHRSGNKFLTSLLNLLFRVKLNDCFTCYKLLRRDTMNTLGLKAQGFDIEIEIIAKALKKRLRIEEEFVHYHPRSYSEGKKIRCKDGLNAALSILKYRFGE